MGNKVKKIVDIVDLIVGQVVLSLGQNDMLAVVVVVVEMRVEIGVDFGMIDGHKNGTCRMVDMFDLWEQLHLFE